MDIATAADYRALARQRLDPVVWRYLEAGSGDERCLAANQHAFAAAGIVPRPLADVRGGHTRLSLFGMSLEHPILPAPIAYQRLFHTDGECGSAAAADAQGVPFIASSLASQPFAEIARAAERPWWFQLYWQGDRERSHRLLQRAESAGCAAVVFTVDAPVKQAALQLPPQIAAVNLEAPLDLSSGAGASAVFDGWTAQAPDWNDLAWLRGQTHLPLLVKGFLHPDDARHALALGCDGLIVSNHGGRVLDSAPAALDVLPAMRTAVGTQYPLLVDSGIRNGRDVFAALAAGADAVLLGRPYIWGLAAAGAMGVAHVLRLTRDELEMTMALAGCRTLRDIAAGDTGKR